MEIRLGRFPYTEVWDGVLYKNLPDYPRISDWEMRNLSDFVRYETAHGRNCPVVCEDAALAEEVSRRLALPGKRECVPPPAKITECTACRQHGCLTAFVCHTASVENAERILACGSLYSAVRARGLPGEVLMLEKRNAAHDPADWFDYVMFSWGNCQAGDRLVMERALGRMPDENDLSVGFHPGVRFYFRYETLLRYPGAVTDGVLPVKIRDGVVLGDTVFRIVIPEEHFARLAPVIPDALSDRILRVENACRDIWAWSEMVYGLIERADAEEKGRASV